MALAGSRYKVIANEKLQHWRGFAGIFSPEAAPMLEFYRFMRALLFAGRINAQERPHRMLDMIVALLCADLVYVTTGGDGT